MKIITYCSIFRTIIPIVEMTKIGYVTTYSNFFFSFHSVNWDS